MVYYNEIKALWEDLLDPVLSTPSTQLPTTTEPSHVPLRRSSRPHNPPTYLQDYNCNLTYPIQHTLDYTKLPPSYHNYVMQITTIYEPEFFRQAVKFAEWCKVMAEELVALETNNTWTVEPLPLGKHPIGCRWLYKVKYKADGSLDKHKARLVPKGYTQQAGIDFTETFSL